MFAPQVEADAEAIRLWVRGADEPDFAAIAERILPAVETLLERNWVKFTDDWRERLEQDVKLASEPPSTAGYRGAVAELVELVRWALRPDRPRRPPRGPLAAQMALGRRGQ
jgi:hypothetical protein